MELSSRRHDAGSLCRAMRQAFIPSAAAQMTHLAHRTTRPGLLIGVVLLGLLACMSHRAVASEAACREALEEMRSPRNSSQIVRNTLSTRERASRHDLDAYICVGQAPHMLLWPLTVHATNGHGNMVFTIKGVVDIGNWEGCQGA